jgi:hypothetical protein
MRISIGLIVLLAGAGAVHAAAPDEESPRALSLAAGLGLAAPLRQNGQDVEGDGRGGYAAAEYIFRLKHWFTPRLYAGGLIAPSQSNCGAGVVPCDVSATILFAGAKFRVMAPIPYVGPFIELGLGASAGRISTRSGRQVDVTGEGLMYHVPFALGVAIGRRHEFAVRSSTCSTQSRNSSPVQQRWA